jgi:Tfp pilus assembly protein PilF
MACPDLLPPRTPKATQVALVLALLLSACAMPPEGGLSEVMQRPAERTLLAGLRAYDDAQYADAERELGKALAAGLVSARDRANAHKHLAFIYCTSQRLTACAEAFRAARAADPDFALSRAEAGHPLWGPVYRRVAGRP